MRRTLVCLLLAFWPTIAFAAEPLTLLILHLLRQQLANAIEQAIEQSQREKERQRFVIPPAPYDLDDARLRALIDEGFVHLDRAQRDEVFASLKKILSDPANAAIKPMLVQELAVKASAVRQAHEQFSRLSLPEKRALVAEARSEYEKLPPEERVQMLQVLRSGVVPLPRDLSEMMLAEFSAVVVENASRRSE